LGGSAASRGLDCGVGAGLHPAKGALGLIFRVDGVGKIHRLIGAQLAHQALVKRDELRLLVRRCDPWQGLWLAILDPQPGQKLDAA